MPAQVAPDREVPIAHTPEKTTKRKSSWDTLTSFFGISSATESETKAPEISSAAPAETDALSRPTSRGGPEARRREARSDARSESRREARPASGHGRSPEGRGEGRSEGRSQESRTPEAKPPAVKPTALDSLFGDAPRQELSWEKPAPRRMVDDISAWDDDEPAAIAPEFDDAEAPFVEPETLVGGGEAAAGGDLEQVVLEEQYSADQLRGAGLLAGPGSRPLGRHLAAFLGATTARLGAFLAMRGVMLRAFLRARVADRGANFTDISG